MKPRYLIVHNTATLRDHTTFEAVNNYHKRLGWGKIGYQFLINGKGNLYGYPQARGQDEVGAHTKADGMNYKSIGIALTGNFQREHPSKIQLTVLKNLLDDLRKAWKIPAKNVLGHREVKEAKTACPGDNLMTFIKEYRTAEEVPLSSQNELLRTIERLRQDNSQLKTKNTKLTNKLSKCKISKQELKVALEDQQGWFSKQIKKYFKDE